MRVATCLQTDDTNNIGTKAFLELEEKMGCHVERKPIVNLEGGGTPEFHAANIHLNNCVYSISQTCHINQFQKILTDTEVNKSAFISPPARGAYIASLSRPDLTARFAILAQCQNPKKDDIVELNKLIRMAKHNSMRLDFSKLNNDCFLLAVFTDASFARNQDLSSQL